jgi:hypothetical protein
MKKLLLLTILILSLSTLSAYAQKEELPPENAEEEVLIQIQEDQSTLDEDIEPNTTTSEDVQVIQQKQISFGSILFATITPALLILVAYLLIKMTNK